MEEEDFADIDERALRKIERIDRCIEKLRRNDHAGTRFRKPRL